MLTAVDLELTLRTALAYGGPPGIAVSGEIGEILISAASGLERVGRDDHFSEKTAFPIGCIVKPLLAMVCTELHVRRELDLFAPINELLPGVALQAKDEPPITMAHLLSHTAGYVEPQSPRARWTITWDEFRDYFVQRQQAFLPGTVFSYTQTGHSIVARIVEQATGVDPIHLIEDMLLEPTGVRLGSDHPGADRRAAALHVIQRGRYEAVRLPPENAMLRTSISARTLSSEDLVPVGRLLAGILDNTSISSNAYALFSEPVISVPDASGSPLREACPTAFGLGLGHYGRLVGHSGSYVGATCAVRTDHQSGATLAVGANAWCPGLRDQIISNLFYNVTGSGEFIARPRCRISSALKDYEGEYACLMLGMGNAVITVDGNSLQCEIRLPTGASRASLRSDVDGFISGKIGQPNLTLALARAPDGEPYLLVGMSAYKKV
jgi:CubicO group peptidase (beta-lactamase class C family)